MFVSDADAPELPLEHLEHEIVQLASHVNAGMCRWLELLAEFDRREGWGGWNCRSCAEWVAWRCGLDPRSAREHVRVARRLAELPATRERFARGELSYSKVRALTRVATDDNECELLELAEHATASQLERIVRGMRRMNGADAALMQENRYLSCWWEADGSLSVSGNLPPEDGAALLSALEAMHDLLRERTAAPGGSAEPLAGKPGASSEAVPATPDSSAEEGSEIPGGSAEPRQLAGVNPWDPLEEPRRATNADALVAMAQTAVAGGAQASSADRRDVRAHRELVVHVDAGTLAGRTEHGCALAPETVRRLGCDAALVGLVEGEDGSALHLGRKTRTIPAALERALRAREETCGFPGCDRRRFLDAHHIRHWADGGTTEPGNLVRLCRRHHRALHEGGHTAERCEDGTVEFRDPHGIPVQEAPPLPRGDADALPQTAPDALQGGTGERLDLHHTLAVIGDNPRLMAGP